MKNKETESPINIFLVIVTAGYWVLPWLLVLAKDNYTINLKNRQEGKKLQSNNTLLLLIVIFILQVVLQFVILFKTVLEFL